MKIWEIVRLIEESPVKAIESATACHITFETPEGHQYEVFFDCGEVNYLTWLKLAGEETIDFWKSPINNAAYLAGNLAGMPHVAGRLFKAARQAGIDLF